MPISYQTVRREWDKERGDLNQRMGVSAVNSLVQATQPCLLGSPALASAKPLPRFYRINETIPSYPLSRF